MAEVRLVDLELIKRYSLAVRRDTVDAEELLAVLDASRATVAAVIAGQPAPPRTPARTPTKAATKTPTKATTRTPARAPTKTPSKAKTPTKANTPTKPKTPTKARARRPAGG